jgi:flavin reductase (DIM6/NTAB) family NADH-FMN oxidoreductase RutF
VHVLAAQQIELSRRFSRNCINAFEGLELEAGTASVPLLSGCLSRFECERLVDHDGGDHLIVVARVTAACLREGEPLVFSSGGYGRFDRFDPRTES